MDQEGFRIPLNPIGLRKAGVASDGLKSRAAQISRPIEKSTFPTALFNAGATPQQAQLKDSSLRVRQGHAEGRENDFSLLESEAAPSTSAEKTGKRQIGPLERMSHEAIANLKQKAAIRQAAAASFSSLSFIP